MFFGYFHLERFQVKGRKRREKKRKRRGRKKEVNMLGLHLHSPWRWRRNQLGGSKGGYVHHGHSRELARKMRKENCLLEPCQEQKGSGALPVQDGCEGELQPGEAIRARRGE